MVILEKEIVVSALKRTEPISVTAMKKVPWSAPRDSFVSRIKRIVRCSLP